MVRCKPRVEPNIYEMKDKFASVLSEAPGLETMSGIESKTPRNIYFESRYKMVCFPFRLTFLREINTAVFWRRSGWTSELV
jgi:hypothetical protein